MQQRSLKMHQTHNKKGRGNPAQGNHQFFRFADQEKNVAAKVSEKAKYLITVKKNFHFLVVYSSNGFPLFLRA